MSHIWVPKVGILEGELFNPRPRLRGEYTLERVKADGTVVQKIGPFPNLITNIGLDRIGTSLWQTHAFVGTGTSTPSVTDTKLSAWKASHTTRTAWADSAIRGGAPDYWVQGVGTWRFGLGVAAGNLTEVSIGWLEPLPAPATDADKNRAFSRALIVDGDGDPVAITVLEDEYLDVTYSLRHYPYIGDPVSQSVTLSGTTYTFTSQVCNVGANYAGEWRMGVGSASAYSGTAAGTPPALNAITGFTLLTPGTGYRLRLSNIGYDGPGSHSVSCVLYAGLDDANGPWGIRGMEMQTELFGVGKSVLGQKFQTVISPAIPKDASNVLSFGVKFGWDRY